MPLKDNAIHYRLIRSGVTHNALGSKASEVRKQMIRDLKTGGTLIVWRDPKFIFAHTYNADMRDVLDQLPKLLDYMKAISGQP